MPGVFCEIRQRIDFDIHLHAEDTATLFVISYSEILSIECADNMTDDKNAELINLLDFTMVPTGSEGSSVSLYLYVVSRDIREDVCIVPK